jgi:urease accessory protein
MRSGGRAASVTMGALARPAVLVMLARMEHARATAVLPAGTWNAAEARDRVLIDFDRRHRRRITLTTETGAEILLDLPRAARLRGGDGLVLDDGGIVAVVARPEPLAEIHAHDDETLIRITWHLGNRHLPVQFVPGHLRIRRDHVIEAMIEGLGGHVEAIEAPFDPEAGAYAGGHGHVHDGDDDADGGHGHGHGHGHHH